MKVETTLNKLREAGFFRKSYNQLAAALSNTTDPKMGEKYLSFDLSGDKLISIEQIYSICGFKDAYWVISSKAVTREVNMYAGKLACIFCAPLLYLLKDSRSWAGFAARIRHSIGEITDVELDAASEGATNAARSCTNEKPIVESAAWSIAEVAARNAAAALPPPVFLSTVTRTGAIKNTVRNIILATQEKLFLEWFELF